MRRLIRRAVRFAFDLGIEQNLTNQIVPVIADLYKEDMPEVMNNEKLVIDILNKEEILFRKTLKAGVREFAKLAGGTITGDTIFRLYDTFGFPVELSIEEAFAGNVELDSNWRKRFDELMELQRERSRTATKGEFKGGLADHSEIITKYHTATHLMYRALRIVLGDHVVQRGSNITSERLRFDFSHGEKMTPEQIQKVEKIVNEQIDKDLPVSWVEENTQQAFTKGVAGAFGDRYGEIIKVYTIGDPNGEYFSREICGGPHVEHTAQLADGGKRFKIIKEESSSAGVRRIKAILQ
jgi:alanyl-tRNA synthetase